MASLKNNDRTQCLFVGSDSDISLSCAKTLAGFNVDVQAVVLEPDTPKQIAAAIVAALPGDPPLVLASRPDKDPLILELMASNSLDLLLCCWYRYRIRPSLLKSLKTGAINLHPSVLPHNKSRHSAFWGIMNGTPLGATIHWMDETFDTGDLIGQAQFEDDGIISAEEVYERQLSLCIELFNQHIASILEPNPPRIKQPEGGSYHFEDDILLATTFDGSDTIDMAKLLRLARGTNVGTHGFYVELGERKFKIQASVTEVTK